ncbi:MAG: AraC family transcriptional regulator [Butyrivibrio sp.]|nr:AraC family transcriptional regulator [Muribaculum sp.]MCM1553695.1 AraC family transcriptional regulator [Butyrivibrio sp.]
MFYYMGFLIRGDRTTITPSMTYTQHQGALGVILPFQYHQTFPASDEPYESILVKFTLDFVKPFTDIYGLQIMDVIYAYPSNEFDKEYEGKLHRLFLDMVEVYNGDSDFKEFTLQCMLFQVFIIIIEHRILNKNAIIYKTALTKEIMESVCFIESHYHEAFSMDDVAGMVGFSPSYFSKIFKKQLGKTYSEYLSMVRVTHAESLLVNTSKSVTEIAMETGFSYSSKLTEAFKRCVGITPLEYRKTYVDPYAKW